MFFCVVFLYFESWKNFFFLCITKKPASCTRLMMNDGEFPKNKQRAGPGFRQGPAPAAPKRKLFPDSLISVSRICNGKLGSNLVQFLGAIKNDSDA